MDFWGIPLLVQYGVVGSDGESMCLTRVLDPAIR